MIKVYPWGAKSGQPVHSYPDNTTKADIARDLFKHPNSYSVTEVSKAVGMAYSQAHSVYKKMGEQPAPVRPKATKAPPPIGVSKVRNVRGEAKQAEAETKRAHKVLDRERASEAAGKRPGPKTNPRVGKLRIGNLPQDIEVSSCANCGYDLRIRRTPEGFVFVHVNATPEEYLRTIQFCHAVPESLVQ